MLPEPSASLWNVYQQMENDRIRTESDTALQAFLGSIRVIPMEQWRDWAFDLSRRVVDENESFPVRLPLFREALFPALLAGARSGRPGCARWLAGFARLLHHCPNEREQVADLGISETELLRVALTHSPSDERALLRLIRCLESHLEFAIHELPSVILYDNREATASECGALLQELEGFSELVRRAGLEEQFRDFLEECRFHFIEYPGFQAHRSDYQDYADYLCRQVREQEGSAGNG